MIALTGTGFLEALMAGAAATTDPTFYTSYGVTDAQQDFARIAPANGSLNGATPVTLVAAPVGPELRHDVRDLTIFNVDTQTNTLTLRVDIGGAKHNLWTGDVTAGGFVRLENSTGRVVIYSSLGEETSSGAALISHAPTHELGGSDEVDHDLLKNFVLDEHRLLNDAAATATNLWSASKIQSELLTSADVLNSYDADQLDSPSGSNWAVDAFALAEQDDDSSSLVVRAFDDTLEEGVGLSVVIPIGATEIMFRTKARARTAPPALRTVGLKAYFRSFPDNASPSAWSGGTTLNDVDIPTNENFQYDSETFTLAALGLSAGVLYQFEITRVAPGFGTDLVGDWLLSQLQIEFNVEAAATSTLFSADLMFPTNADWAVNAHASESVDSNNEALVVRRFDDTLEEGVGIATLVPTTATQMKIKFKSRAETAPGGAVSVIPKIYTREFPDNTAPTAWSAGLALTTLAIPTNENFQYDEQTLTLATLNLAAGRFALLEITRDAPAGGDDLVGDWALASIQIEFI
jgi:hypothetical protein